MQQDRSHVPLILIAFLSSSVFSFIGCQKQTDKKKEAQLIEANAEALLIPRQSDTGGFGLGLAIAKDIVELHGGNIFVECTNNRILFTVVLPINAA